MKNIDVVIDLLLRNGWEENGRTGLQSFKVITKESYPLAGGIMNLGNRLRFKKGDWKVTVGKQTTFFYHPKVGTSYLDEGNKHLRTGDITQIKSIIEELATAH